MICGILYIYMVVHIYYVMSLRSDSMYDKMFLSRVLYGVCGVYIEDI
jgi:hypothetical protein